MKVFKSMLPVTLINYIALFCITLNLPEKIPNHLNAKMEIDGFASKWIIMIIGAIPLILSALMLIYRYATRNIKSILKNRKVENILFPIITAFLTLVTWAPVLLAFQPDASLGMKIDFPLNSIILLGAGIFMIVISNFMGVIKHNSLLGIRTPWTLANEVVWKKTHRLGGHTGVTGGILMCIFSVPGFIFKTYVLSIIGFILGISLIAIVPIVYSYIIYKKEKLK